MSVVEIIALVVVASWFIYKYENLKHEINDLKSDYDDIKHRLDCVTDRISKEDIEKIG